jgi:hypothetical protein
MLKNVATWAYTVYLMLFVPFDFRENGKKIKFSVDLYLFARISSSMEVECLLTETVFVEFG